MAAYKEIVDQLASQTSHGVIEKIVDEKGVFVETSDAAVYNPLLKSLTADQRKMLARMIHRERVSAILDVLALLTWWITVRGLSFTFQGEAMPVDLRGAALHGHYAGRPDDWKWPD